MFRILFIPTPHSRAIVLLSTQLYSQKQKSQEAKLLIYETCESLVFKNAKHLFNLLQIIHMTVLKDYLNVFMTKTYLNIW